LVFTPGYQRNHGARRRAAATREISADSSVRGWRGVRFLTPGVERSSRAQGHAQPFAVQSTPVQLGAAGQKHVQVLLAIEPSGQE
jgi:hypothetical protein